ncbi:hypothetical protein SeLEV6574_g03374 [Synchytrium endobioticum]|uniref:Uncharacterized protein n=1 Tax=Synchytrium endobioticum TaxID=286115 RepID=A0A507CLL5_9FUNG|nr:hypothetical protein SeLEV6574_g07101 [Synchytrium endobioticum]TPX46146.1 hypothetical protein SeLEV6574_g03374 [Synchytrium endobioticum]
MPAFYKNSAFLILVVVLSFMVASSLQAPPPTASPQPLCKCYYQDDTWKYDSFATTACCDKSHGDQVKGSRTVLDERTSKQVTVASCRPGSPSGFKLCCTGANKVRFSYTNVTDAPDAGSTDFVCKGTVRSSNL